MTKEKQLEGFIEGLKLRYFKGKEFTPYWSRTRSGVKNSCPHESLWPNIAKTIIVLDEIRHLAKQSISITSTYRSPAYNKAVGGEGNSFHMKFNAIDFQCSKITPLSLWRIARSLRGKRFDLRADGATFIFRGGLGLYPTFVHIDTRGNDANW